MFLFHSIHFLKFLVKSQPQRSYKKDPCKEKRVYIVVSLEKAKLVLASMEAQFVIKAYITALKLFPVVCCYG